MKFLFGKSEAALKLEQIVGDNPKVRSKVMKHISNYFRYLTIVSKIEDKEVRSKTLMYGLDCNLDVSSEIKTFIRNVKVAKRRELLLELH